MKRTVSNSYLYAFYKSGYFFPLLLFTILSILNNIIFLQKNFVDYDWHYLFALWGGFCHDLFFFTLVILVLAFICKLIPKLKVLSLLILHALLLLPIFDYYYFKATLERFNWIVLQFINYHSAKGYIGNMGNAVAGLTAILLLGAACLWLSSKKEKYAEPYSEKFLLSICIFFFFGSLFTNNIVFPIESYSNDGKTKLVFWGHKEIIDGKNRVLGSLSKGSIYGFLPKYIITDKSILFKEYTDKEKKFLEANGLLPVSSSTKKEVVFNKVIMIVLESFALEYIHVVNSDIPAEVSPYFDYLISSYPHLNNFYTSDFPSLQGFNAILSSKIPFDEKKNLNQSYNLASMFEAKYPATTWFLRGSSRVFGNEDIVVKNIFGFSNLIGYEDLTQVYPEPKGFVWGYLDNILYNKAEKILNSEKNNSFFMVIKLLNQHQPILYDIKNASDLPESVCNHPNDIVKIIYNADKLLKNFIETCERSNIIDDKTLVVITADHYPPLGYGHTELIKSYYNFQLGRLPLIFYSKRNEVFNRLNKDVLCCQLDIAPTLCELLGFDIPKEHMGQSLLSENFKPRSIGILNKERIFFQSEELNFNENIINPATESVVLRKWINNLLADN